jgi:hypothetical protein
MFSREALQSTTRDAERSTPFPALLRAAEAIRQMGDLAPCYRPGWVFRLEAVAVVKTDDRAPLLLGVELKAGPQQTSMAVGEGRQAFAQRNSRAERFARFLRHTIQVCPPGVSISVCSIPFDFSHSRKFRFSAIK